ncbi:hypothetical protein BCV69DRAFT_93146 [Microstroma glucosiphilum]|uniref:VLRF1 domain-containing protein n=1 Tax=Pseudomicrostroma glucosiphilum TaxID=1684307 RepID=A0A316UHH6_9BASI|nr:hypothetical protein BCV69DRAFT_93146 [Pseudomicrostroma glucosiphilum]PWN22645.1 hypothetical protein BCV69DRAFT_93146 [Pseudomicrostroma glucosiphilum]
MTATPPRRPDEEVDSTPSSPRLSTNGSLSSSVKQRHPLLHRPLYAFQLPPTLLSSLKLRSIDVETPAEAQKGESSAASGATAGGPSAAALAQTATTSTNLTCKLCPSQPTFPTSGHQRAHFRSEWHRYNLQVALKTGGAQGKAVGLVDEKGWEDLVNDLGDGTEEESVGGSTDEEGASKPARASDLVSLVVKKLHLNGASSTVAFETDEPTIDEEDEDEELMVSTHSRGGAVTAKSALLWFTTQASDASDRVHLEQTQFGLYRSIFPDVSSTTVPSSSAGGWHVSALQANQAAPLRRAPVRGSQGSGWKGKRLKGMDDAAIMLGVNFLEGEGYVPGLVTVKPERGQGTPEDSEEDSDGQVASSSSEGETEVTISTSSALPRSLDPPLRTWTVLLFGGGHFSIVVVALNPHIAPRVASRNRPLPPQGSDEEAVSEDRSLIVLAHKAFHRYTTRRKQGGSQSAQDASGKFAKSAGAQLRRAGEVALVEEVRALLNLSGWRKLIGETERVYARAGGRAARGILWTWGGDVASPLEGPKTDGRLRTVPFSTRNKATVGECLRVFAELAKVKISRRTDQELEEEDEAYRRSLTGNQAAREELQKRRERERLEREQGLAKLREKAKKRKGEEGLLSKEEKKRRERFERMIDMARRGRIEALVNHLEKYGPQLLPAQGWEAGEEDKESSIDASLPEWWRARQLPASSSSSSKKTSSLLIPSTLLQLAAEAGQEDVVQWLLVEKRADPTIGVSTPPAPPTEASQAGTDTPAPAAAVEASSDTPWPHRTAYDLVPSSSKGTRNVFRRLKANQPDWYDWSGKARVVDSALTGEMEENQSRRKAGLREKARAREREREEREREKESQQATAAPAPAAVVSAPASSATKNRLGGGNANQGTAASRAAKDARDKMEGVSPEMRARIEREKRARAAEERMKKLQGGGSP